MKQKTILSEVVSFIRNFEINSLISRKDLVPFGGQAVDNYRNYLTHAGYLEVVGRGLYKYLREIPENITYGRLVKEAYPSSEWTQKYKYIPNTLDEAIDILVKANTGNVNIADDEDTFLCDAHHGMGRYLRNTWGLWTGSKLQSWFKERGIHHADDMSSIILSSFHRKLHNNEIKLEQQIKQYRKYWEKTNPNVNKGIL